MVPFTNIQIKLIQIMFLMNLNRYGPFCVIKTFVKPLPSWAALVNLFVLKVFQNIAVAISVCFHSLLLSLGSNEDLSHENFEGWDKTVLFLWNEKDSNEIHTVWVPHLFLTQSNMTVTVLRLFGGMKVWRCFKVNQPLQNHVVILEKKGGLKVFLIYCRWDNSSWKHLLWKQNHLTTKYSSMSL